MYFLLIANFWANFIFYYSIYKYINIFVVTESALSFPRFGNTATPFGGLGSLREAANPLNYPGLVSSVAGDPFGLSRPGFPPIFSSPSTSLASPGWPSHHRPNPTANIDTKPKLQPSEETVYIYLLPIKS